MRSLPVLLLGFNRPELLHGLVDSLRPVRPTRVYLVVDGPRQGVPSDVHATQACRKVADAIDWECDLCTWFRDENSGCARGVSDAITWFFEHEEEGVILEDDVRVHPTFFDFCEVLLERYRNESRVCAISGCNFVPPCFLERARDYRFTRITNVWGWATWRRAWSEYQHNMSQWRRQLPISKLREACPGAPVSVLFWCLMFELVSRGVIDSWAFRFIFAALRTGGLTATSNINLVTNVGDGAQATHTRSLPADLPPPRPVFPPYDPPHALAVDEAAERWVMRNVMGATLPGISKQGLRFLTRQLHRLTGLRG